MTRFALTLLTSAAFLATACHAQDEIPAQEGDGPAVSETLADESFREVPDSRADMQLSFAPVVRDAAPVKQVPVMRLRLIDLPNRRIIHRRRFAVVLMLRQYPAECQIAQQVAGILFDQRAKNRFGVIGSFKVI